MVDLPTLPKIYKRAEAAFGLRFREWLLKVHKENGVYELKVAKNNRLPFSSVLPHQITFLENVRHGVFVYKIVDMGTRNPFDYVSLVRQPAWLVIKYEKFFCLIAIDVFQNERFRSKQKSITSERAREISTIIVPN